MLVVFKQCGSITHKWELVIPLLTMTKVKAHIATRS